LCHLHLSLFIHSTDSSTSQFYTRSLHDALPISGVIRVELKIYEAVRQTIVDRQAVKDSRLALDPVEVQIRREFFRILVEDIERRSEEHTSELQSRVDLVCRLLIEKEKKQNRTRE